MSKIIDHKTLSFNEAEYKKYPPLFLSTTFAISYGLSFASILATITHTEYKTNDELGHNV